MGASNRIGSLRRPRDAATGRGELSYSPGMGSDFALDGFFFFVAVSGVFAVLGFELFFGTAPFFFFGAPLAARSAIRVMAWSSVTERGSLSRTVALVVPSVT